MGRDVIAYLVNEKSRNVIELYSRRYRDDISLLILNLPRRLRVLDEYSSPVSVEDVPKLLTEDNNVEGDLDGDYDIEWYKVAFNTIRAESAYSTYDDDYRDGEYGNEYDIVIKEVERYLSFADPYVNRENVYIYYWVSI